VIPQVDRIGGAISQISVFNVDPLIATGLPPKYRPRRRYRNTNTGADHEGWALPWIPQRSRTS
jgi:hypothetical protein